MGDNFEFNFWDNLGYHMEDVFEVNFWENFFGNCRDNLGDNFGNKLSGSDCCKTVKICHLLQRLWN